MKKSKLVKGSARRAIAMASAFMMTCSTVAGSPYCGVISAYAEEAALSQKDVETDTAEEDGEAADETEESGEGGAADETEEDGESGVTDETEESGESGAADETEESGESGAADETEESGESGAADETEESGESGAADETEESGEGGMADETEESGESSAADETEENEENGAKDESKESHENDLTDETEAVNGTGEANGLAGTVADEEKKLSAQQQMQMAMQDAGTWYIAIGSYEYDDEYYYLIDGETGDKTLIKNQYIEVEREDGNCIIHVDENGKMKVGWLGNEEEGYRFAKGDGKVIVNKQGKEAGTYYGDFDEEGYWTPVENVFFDTELDDGTPIVKYAGTGGEVAGEGKGKERQSYCFEGEDKKCYLYSADASNKEEVFNKWLYDLWIGENGCLLTDASQKQIEGKYYDFDADGHSMLVTVSIIYDTDGKIVCYVDEKGERAANVFASDGRYTYYFGDDGEQVFRQWIEEAGTFRYVNDKGHLVVNTTKAVGGYYGDFDGEGYWTAIEDEFFEDELDDGTVVTKYAAKEGKIAGIGEKEDRKYYCFVPAKDGKCYLYSADETNREPVTNTWIEDLWVNGKGYLLTNADEELIDGKYYKFNEEGHGTLITNSFIRNTDGDIVCYVNENGEKLVDVDEQPIGDLYYNFDDAGNATLVTNAFIHDESGDILHYVDAEGKKITDAKEMQIAGKYYDFDGTGYVTLITNTFIYSNDEILCYVGTDGEKVTGVEEQKVGDYYYCIDAVGGVSLITNSFIHDGSGNIMHYVDGDGVKVTGVLEMQIGVKYYNFDDAGYVTLIANAFIHDTAGNILHYLNETGEIVTGVKAQQVEGKYYEIDGSGDVTLLRNSLIRDEAGTILCYVDENGIMVTNRFVVIDGDTLYFGEDGTQVFHRWIEEDGRFRFVDGKGHMVVDDTRIAGGYYGHFDGSGYWTAIENTLFHTRLDDETAVMEYAGEGGKVAGIGDVPNRQYYCFVKETGGKVHCYLTSAGGESLTAEMIKNIWIGSLWVNEDGSLSVNVENQRIGDKYYRFDADGYSTLITNALVYVDADTVYYVDGDGTIVTSQYITIGGHTLYFGADGAQVFHQWLEDGGKFRYINGKGYMIVDAVKAAGGYYGRFDKDGYWTAIENTFFETELDDGTLIMEYAGKAGEIAGIGKGMENRQFYCFLKGANGMIRCGLLSVGGESISENMVADTWIDDMRVNGEGYLIISAEEPVDGVYYRFDENGHGMVITYQVAYVLGGGANSDANPSSYTGAMDTIVLEAPSRTGYTFDGWYLDSGFTIRITEIASKSHGDITLYAKWTRKSSSSGDSDSDSSSSGSSSDSSNNSNTGGTAVSGTITSGTTSVSVTVGENQNVTVQTGGTTVSAATAQTAEGSVSGNTIVSTTEKVAVTVAEGQVAEIATVAVGADGSARALLASEVQGATVQQKTVVVQGVEVTQNVVVYADGTQVTQKSGVAELGGFAENVVSAETAIQNGSQTVAAVYNDKVDIDLQQYQQVGAAVTYEVTAGINGAAPQTQMEQTNFAPGQEVTALITDVNGNVTAVTVVVGANGVIQYQIPGVNCIVRLMRKI